MPSTLQIFKKLEDHVRDTRGFYGGYKGQKRQQMLRNLNFRIVDDPRVVVFITMSHNKGFAFIPGAELNTPSQQGHTPCIPLKVLHLLGYILIDSPIRPAYQAKQLAFLFHKASGTFITLFQEVSGGSGIPSEIRESLVYYGTNVGEKLISDIENYYHDLSESAFKIEKLQRQIKNLEKRLSQLEGKQILRRLTQK